MATEPLPFSSASSIVPSSNNPQNDELHFLSDPKFERHGEILLLVFVILFSVFLFCICIMSSRTGCVLIPSHCHEKMEGPCHLLICMHQALCRPNVVCKKDIISRALVSVKCICAIRISSCIHPFLL